MEVTLSERKKINKQTNAFCLMDKKGKTEAALATDDFLVNFLSVVDSGSFFHSINLCLLDQLLMRGFGNSDANVRRQG